MPIGGERIGSAFVRIYGDGSSLPDDVRRSLEDSEPAIRASGRRLGDAYAEEFNGGLTRDDTRDFGRGLRENLERSIAESDLTSAYFESEDFRRFRGRLRQQFGEAGDIAGRRLQERFEAAGSARGLSDSIRNIIPEVRRATEELVAAEREAFDATNADRDRDFERRVRHLADLANLQQEAIDEDRARTQQGLDDQQADRDRDFVVRVRELAERAALQDEAAEEDRERTRRNLQIQSEDRDRAFDLEIERQRAYAELFDQAAREEREREERRGRETVAIRDRTDRSILARADALQAALGRLGTNQQRDSRRQLIRELTAIQNSLGAVSPGAGRDDLNARLIVLRRNLRDSTPESDRFSRSLLRLGDALGSGTGRGSRNNFVNAIGASVRGLTNLITLGPRVAFQVGQKMANAFTDAGGGLSGAGAAAIELGKALGAGAAVAGAVSIAVVALIAVLGPLAALISGIVAALTALVSTIALGAIAGIVALAGALVPLVAGFGVGVAAVLGMSDAMKDRLQPEIDRLKRAFQTLGESAGDELGPKIETALKGLAPIVRSLEPLVDGIARGLGDVAIQFSRSFQSDGFKEGIRALTEGPKDAAREYNFLEERVKDLGGALQGTLGGLGGFFLAARPLIRDFTRSLERIGQEFSDYANSKEGRREIREFLRDAGDSAETLLDFLGQVTSTFGTLFNAGNETGDTIFDDLTQKAEELQRFLRDNPDSVADFFGNGLEIARDIGNAILFLVEVFDDLDTKEAREDLQSFFDVLGTAAEYVGYFITAVEFAADSLGTLLFIVEGAVESFQALFNFLQGDFDVSGFETIQSAVSGIKDALNFGDGGDGLGKLVEGVTLTADSFAKATEVTQAFKDGVVTAADSTGKFASTLRDLSGAATEATEKLILQNAIESGAFEQAQALGISGRDLVNSTLGRADAIDRVNEALTVGSITNREAVTAILAFTGGQKDAIEADRLRIQETARLSQSFKNLRGEVSEPLRLKLEEEGIKPTLKGLAETVFEYDELQNRKDIKKLIQATGVPVTIKQVLDVVARLKDLDKQNPKPKVGFDASQFIVGERNVRSNIRQLDGERATPAAGFDASQFFDGTRAVRNELIDIDGKRATAFIDIVARRVGDLSPFGADGGTVGKGTLDPNLFKGLSAGGTIPGPRFPYGDRDLYRLAPGEEVVSNSFGQADQYRNLLKAISAGRPIEGTVPGLGKTVDASGWTVITDTADPAAVASEVLNQLMAKTF